MLLLLVCRGDIYRVDVPETKETGNISHRKTQGFFLSGLNNTVCRNRALTGCLTWRRPTYSVKERTVREKVTTNARFLGVDAHYCLTRSPTVVKRGLQTRAIQHSISFWNKSIDALYLTGTNLIPKQ